MHFVTYFKNIDIKNCIYFNIPTYEKGNEKLISLIDLYRNILITDKRSYDYHILSDFGRQISSVLNYKDPKSGYKLFVANYQYFFDALFQIIFESKRKDSLYVISRLNLSLSDILKVSKISDLKKFCLFLINKSNDALKYLIKNQKRLDEEQSNKVKEFKSCADLFGEFSRHLYFSYLTDSQFKDKSCGKPCLDLIITLLEALPQSQQCFYIVERFLRKEEFYLLKNFHKETESILSRLFDLALEMDLTSRDDRNGHLKESLDQLKRRISPFPETIEFLQDCLYKNIIYKPIEMNVSTKEYFYIINDYVSSFVSFKNFPSEVHELHYLRRVFKIAVSSEVFDSIQPDQLDMYHGRVSFFKIFYRKISECLSERKDIADQLGDDLVELVDMICEKNEFVNEFKSDSLTINYEIIENLSSQVLNYKNSDKRLVVKLIDVWFDLYEAIQMRNVSSKACELIKAACENHTEIASLKSDKLWEYFLSTDDSGSKSLMMLSIQSIFPLTVDKFFAKYSHGMTEMLLRKESTIMNNYAMIYVLAEHAPRYFFLKNQNSNLVIIDLLEKAKQNPMELQMCISNTIMITNNLLSKKTMLQDHDINSVFEARQTFLRCIFVNGEKHSGDGKLLKVDHISLDLQINLYYNVFYFLAIDAVENDRPERLKLLLADIIGG